MNIAEYDNFRKGADVKLFDELEGLSLAPEVRTLLNQKLESLTTFFNQQLQANALNIENYEFRLKQIEQNSTLKRDDLTPEKLIQLLAVQEKHKEKHLQETIKLNSDAVEAKELNRPRVVWDLLRKHFRDEYFLEPIEEDFGITPGSDKMLRDQI